MLQNMPNRVRALPALAAILILALPIAPANAQMGNSPTAQISVDSPAEGATLTSGQQFDVDGWALDAAGPGTGIDEVQVYLDNPMEAGGTLLGTADYGRVRADVAGSFGPAYATAGFGYSPVLPNLSPGSHTLYVYAHSLANGWTYKRISVIVREAPRASYDDRYATNPYATSPYVYPSYPRSYPSYPRSPGQTPYPMNPGYGPGMMRY